MDAIALEIQEAKKILQSPVDNFSLEVKAALALAGLPESKLIAHFIIQKKLTEVEQMQVKLWLANREFNELCAACWKSQLSGTNPISYLQRGNKSNKFLYELVWNSVYFQKSWLDLITHSFEIVKSSYEIKYRVIFPFNTVFELFLETVSVEENSHYKSCLEDGFEMSLNQCQKNHKILATPPHERWKISDNDKNRLTALYKSESTKTNNFWGEFIMNICIAKSRSKDGEFILQRLENFEKSAQNLHTSYLKICSDGRKGRLGDPKEKSFTLVGDRVRYIGTNGSYS